MKRRQRTLSTALFSAKYCRLAQRVSGHLALLEVLSLLFAETLSLSAFK